MRQTRRNSQLLAEAKFFLPDEVVARVSSFLPVRSVLRAALACRRWRAAIARRSLSWTTAIWELDPFAVLGPAGVIQAAGQLPGGWLELARRLGTPRCQFSQRCLRKGPFFGKATLLRTCSSHTPNADDQLLINEFLYDIKPSYTVDSASDLQRAINDCRFGDCILLTADIHVEDCLEVEGFRLQGAPVGAGNACRPRIITCSGPLLAANAIVEGVNLVAGDEEWCDPNQCFPGVQANDTDGVLLRRCRINSCQGTALMACSGGIVAEDCVVSSNGCCLGAVIRDKGPGSNPGFLSMRGCTVEYNSWGAFLGKDTPADVKRAVLAANTFRRNSDEDITEMYSYTGQRVQPWRRGWDSAKP